MINLGEHFKITGLTNKICCNGFTNTHSLGNTVAAPAMHGINWKLAPELTAVYSTIDCQISGTTPDKIDFKLLELWENCMNTIFK